MWFEVAGIDVSPIIPMGAGFLIALVTTPAGISGAFLLLPFQVSALGFATPAVSPTNLLFNVVSTPGGVYGYARRRSLNWSLARIVLAGTMPGVVAGALLRVRLLADAAAFRLFAGAVLVSFAIKLSLDLRKYADEPRTRRSVRRATLVVVSAAVGVVGGIYGIGGGAFIAPFLVSIMGFAVADIAAVALLSTFATSAVGIITFYAVGVAPDVLLGVLFGVGGMAGSYIGARAQEHAQEFALRMLLTLCIGGLGINYLVQGIRSRR